MKMTAHVTCPYCKTGNTVPFEYGEHFKPFLVLCDVEEGGCDKYFVVFVDISVMSTSSKVEPPTVVNQNKNT